MNSSIFNFNTIKMLLFISAILVCFEGGFRIYYFGLPAVYKFWDYSPRGIFGTNLIEPDSNPNITYRLVANNKSMFKATKFNTNSFGFRNIPTTIEKPDGIYRVALLGASVDMGSGVPYNLIYSSRLQQLANSTYPKKIEILNFAVGGYKALQIEESFWESVEPFNPDLVLLPVHLQTFLNRYPPEPTEIRKILETTCLEIRCLFRDFFSLKMVYAKTRDALQSLGRQGWFGIESHWHPSQKSFVAESSLSGTRVYSEQRILNRFMSALTAKGYNIAVLRLPLPTQKSTDKEEILWVNWLSKVKPSLAIDATAEIQPQINSSDTIYPGDSHPNAKVHNLYAEVIFDTLRPFIEKQAPEKAETKNRPEIFTN